MNVDTLELNINIYQVNERHETFFRLIYTKKVNSIEDPNGKKFALESASYDPNSSRGKELSLLDLLLRLDVWLLGDLTK